MERRDFVVSLPALAALGFSLASEARADEHTHPAAKGAPAPAPAAISKELAAVIASTSHCLQTGETCVAHCTALLASGDKSMSDCLRASLNMTAVCGAMFRTASYHTADAKSLAALAKVCADFRRACAKACEAHVGHHAECKACFDSCTDCAKACDALAAA